MKKLVLMATASALALSGCGNDESAVTAQEESEAESTKDNGPVSSADAEQMRLHFQCSQAAKFVVTLVNEAEQAGRLTQIVADPMRRTFATDSASHQLANSQLIAKYGDEKRSEINDIAYKSGEDLKANLNSASDKLDYMTSFLQSNCRSTDFNAYILDLLKDSGLRAAYDDLHKESLNGL